MSSFSLVLSTRPQSRGHVQRARPSKGSFLSTYPSPMGPGGVIRIVASACCLALSWPVGLRWASYYATRGHENLYLR